MGAHHGAWCVGCCWALMASLFSLAAMIALEKLVPRGGRAVVYATALVLLGLGASALAA